MIPSHRCLGPNSFTSLQCTVPYPCLCSLPLEFLLTCYQLNFFKNISWFSLHGTQLNLHEWLMGIGGLAVWFTASAESDLEHMKQELTTKNSLQALYPWFCRRVQNHVSLFIFHGTLCHLEKCGKHAFQKGDISCIDSGLNEISARAQSMEIAKQKKEWMKQNKTKEAWPFESEHRIPTQG